MGGWSGQARSRERVIVKLKRLSGDDEMIVVHAAQRVGIQYRRLALVPEPLRLALRNGPVFALAYADTNGRWCLGPMAPPQDW